MKYNLAFKYIIVQLLIMMSLSGLSAQKARVARANNNYEKYSYINAREIYLKVVEKGYKSAEVYQKLGDTYYFNGEYDQALNWYVKSIEEFPGQTDGEYYYRAAQAQRGAGNMEKYESYIAKFLADNNQNGIKYTISENSNSTYDDYEIMPIKEINTDVSDFGTAFFGNKLVFSSSSEKYAKEKSKKHKWNGERFLDLYQVEVLENKGFSEVVPFDETINSPLHESTPVFTKDGNTVYFTRNNFIKGKRGRDENNNTRLKLYKASKQKDNTWGNIVELPFNSDAYSVAHPALSPDEKKLYFSSDMEGTFGKSDLWYVTINTDGSYGPPVNLGAEINSSEKESFPFISASGKLYFSSNSYNSTGGMDVFVSSPGDDGNYTTAQNLGTVINTGFDDFAFILNEEKGIGYVSSNRPLGGEAISDNIFQLVKKIIISITGKVTSTVSKSPLPGAKLELYDANDNVLETVIADKDGNYNFEYNLEPQSQFKIVAIADDCDKNEKVVISPESSAVVNGDITLNCDDCPPDDLGCRLSLQPIYFDFDKHNIREDAEVELAKILTAMQEYPELKIHIESHTDSRGNDLYNEKLSDRRAKSTMQWLIAQGIASDRLTAKGYGESQLVNECSNNVKCSEEDHQLNRRSMFIIVD